MKRQLISILALLISVAPIFSKERDFDYIFFENSLMEGNWYYSFVNYEDPSWVMNINGHLPVCEDEFSSAGNSLVFNYITKKEKETMSHLKRTYELVGNLNHNDLKVMKLIQDKRKEDEEKERE